MAEKKKASERTSYEVRERWNAANYAQIAFRMNKDDVEKFKEKCARTGISQASVLKDAVYRFLED